MCVCVCVCVCVRACVCLCLCYHLISGAKGLHYYYPVEISVDRTACESKKVRDFSLSAILHLELHMNIENLHHLHVHVHVK